MGHVMSYYPKQSAQFFLVFLCLAMASCTPRVWLKNGTQVGQAEFDRDSMYCMEKSVAAFPPVTTTVVLENKKYVEKGYECKYNPQAFKTECGNTVEVVPEKTQQRDSNENARRDFKWTCMGSLGWAQHETKNKPAATTVQSNMACSSNRDCPSGMSCRSRLGSGGGTECRLKEP